MKRHQPPRACRSLFKKKTSIAENEVDGMSTPKRLKISPKKKENNLTEIENRYSSDETVTYPPRSDSWTEDWSP